jgi:hypothetical protein
MRACQVARHIPPSFIIHVSIPSLDVFFGERNILSIPRKCVGFDKIEDVVSDIPEILWVVVG